MKNRNRRQARDNSEKPKREHNRVPDADGKKDRNVHADTNEALHAESEWEALFRSELDKLDRLAEPNEPDGYRMRQMVEEVRKESRRKLIRDLALFWLLAAALLAGYAFVFVGHPGLFLAIQLAAAAAVPFVLIAAFRGKRVRGRD